MSNNDLPKPFSIDEYVASFRDSSVEESKEKLQKDNLKIEQKIKNDTHNTRQTLIGCVGCTSFLWLVFTAGVVLMLGFKYGGFELSDAVTIAFITTSLGTVLGLLAIGLRYFFNPK